MWYVNEIVCEMGLVSRYKKWWYRRTIRTGIVIVIVLIAYISLVKIFIQCGADDLDLPRDIICEAQDVTLLIASAMLGALLGIDLQRHEDKKQNGGVHPSSCPNH